MEISPESIRGLTNKQIAEESLVSIKDSGNNFGAEVISAGV